MKTAVSIPDPLFKQVEKLTKTRRVSRSEIIAEALEQYLKKLESQHLVDALNRAYGPGNEESGEERSTRDAVTANFFDNVLKD